MSVAITGAGESTSWLQQKSNVARIFSEFVQQDDELSDDWNLLSANTLCAAPVYERFTGFLVYTYLIPTRASRTPAFHSRARASSTTSAPS